MSLSPISCNGQLSEEVLIGRTQELHLQFNSTCKVVQ